MKNKFSLKLCIVNLLSENQRLYFSQDLINFYTLVILLFPCSFSV